MNYRSLLRLVAFASLAPLAACSKRPAPQPAAVPAPLAESEIQGVQALLMLGDHKGAEKSLKPLLKREPMNPKLQLLRDSISGDPKELLGPTNYPYTVRVGETIEQLAERLLGNRLKAYQLARYNDLANPSALTAGQILRIPGSPPRPRPQPAPERASRPVPAAPRPKATATAPAPAPVKSVANPAAAQRARSAGLAALNRGAVNQAVGLLQRAHALDPGNTVILRDLQRAQRIAATVRARQ
ncbi:LysM peptidoglycan-binding domain-containing protein [Sphingomonas psychrotolerans]|uniref:LysM domain-containing protein n=1 Tax=Sphingomonas psychrotolerans TaxID=1327635 RepID=A0A2K8MEL8_9SPHN|nr:LysM domain-containing protein [Sphingomonas psychrotolerans]ATY32297.1 LysM domain-containing protein [Sphingomonas psychrotolerans]